LARLEIGGKELFDSDIISLVNRTTVSLLEQRANALIPKPISIGILVVVPIRRLDQWKKRHAAAIIASFRHVEQASVLAQRLDQAASSRCVVNL
jgi:hypothetical protein